MTAAAPDASALLLRTATPDDTRAAAGAIAALVVAGDVLLLAGELGAGKTAFTQGFGAALGIVDRIVSPTFTIARDYLGGRLVLHHLDVYRLEHLQEASDLGLAELIDDGGVTVIEWGDAIVPVLPADYLEVQISFGEGDDDRRLALSTVGNRWSARRHRLRDALAPWADHAGC